MVTVESPIIGFGIVGNTQVGEDATKLGGRKCDAKSWNVEEDYYVIGPWGCDYREAAGGSALSAQIPGVGTAYPCNIRYYQLRSKGWLKGLEHHLLFEVPRSVPRYVVRHTGGLKFQVGSVLDWSK